MCNETICSFSLTCKVRLRECKWNLNLTICLYIQNNPTKYLLMYFVNYSSSVSFAPT